MAHKPRIMADYHGERLTLQEIADRTGINISTIRKHYKRNGNLDTCGQNKPQKGKTIPHLISTYHPLDHNRPFDRCLMQAGYRSLSQFCKANGLSVTILQNWKRGKPYRKGQTLAKELGDHIRGYSSTFQNVMNATACAEYELFPEIFTESYYRNLYNEYTNYEKQRLRHPHNHIQLAVARLLSTLPARFECVIKARFGLDGLPMTLQAVGDLYGVTRERVRQMEKKAFRLLRSPARKKRLLSAVSRYAP